MKSKKTPRRTSFISIADALKVGRKMSNEEGGLRRLFLPEIEITISSVPVEQLGGGDFHGVVHRMPGRTAVFIGDISGHDFASTIVATKVLDYIEEHEDGLMHPHLFLRGAASELYDHLTQHNRFFTSGVCLADVENNQISYASSGHPQSLLYSAESRAIRYIGKKSLPAGFEKEISYSPEEFEFLPGDIIIMLTDGVSAARSASGDEFGMERIASLLLKYADTPSSIVPRIMGEVNTFTRGSRTTDDETIICILRI